MKESKHRNKASTETKQASLGHPLSIFNKNSILKHKVLQAGSGFWVETLEE